MEKMARLSVRDAIESGSLPENIFNGMKLTVADHGFDGFWFQGIASSAYLDYRNNSRSNLLTRKALLSSGGVLASSPTVQLLHEQYVTRIAPKDINFGQALRLETPYYYDLCESSQPNKAKKLFNCHGVHTILSWPLKHFASDAWSGRFTLLSKHSHKELNLTNLDTTLKKAQMILFEYFYNEINPYRQNNLFNPTAIQVLKMTATGFHNHEISQQLHITVRGVEYHLESMRNKLSACNRANLVHIAHQLEII
jgi:DNA-binding CsgD family transcriptional regulator